MYRGTGLAAIPFRQNRLLSFTKTRSSATKVPFVEKKHPNYARIQELLEECAQSGMWANRSPLYHQLALQYEDHLGVGPDRTVTPCADAGIALEAIARLLSVRMGRKLRWIAPAFSFKNLGRGYFSDVGFVDCNEQGLLDIDQLKQLTLDSFDGIILVNAFGIAGDFEPLFEYARKHDKQLIIDNASGTHSKIPDWPWQSFSLHHTKPYGFGEGGLALTPVSAANELYEIVDHGARPAEPKAWQSNGKLSDVSCAFHLDRLEQHASWVPGYVEQADRIAELAQSHGLRPLDDFASDRPPTTSLPFLCEREIKSDALAAAISLNFCKHYQPNRDTPNASHIWAHVINIPTHPGIAELSDKRIVSDIDRIVQASASN